MQDGHAKHHVSLSLGNSEQICRASLAFLLLAFSINKRNIENDATVPTLSRAHKFQAAKHGERLAGSFVVVTPAQIRFLPMPG